jgi:hypothetical protein
MVAVMLPRFAWYRVDPRGNRPDVNAQFTPPVEQLAFSVQHDGEADLPEVWADPLPIVVEALQASRSLKELLDRLPDVRLVSIGPPARPRIHAL